MPNRPLKPCNKYGCKKLTSARLCPEHQKQYDLDYEQSRKDDPGRRMIQSGRWRKIRSAKLARDPLCERCDLSGLAVPAYLVHHKDRNQLNNKDWNLESLCNECHELEHKEDRWTSKTKDASSA